MTFHCWVKLIDFSRFSLIFQKLVTLCTHGLTSDLKVDGQVIIFRLKNDKHVVGRVLMNFLEAWRELPRIVSGEVDFFIVQVWCRYTSGLILVLKMDRRVILSSLENDELTCCRYCGNELFRGFMRISHDFFKWSWNFFGQTTVLAYLLTWGQSHDIWGPGLLQDWFLGAHSMYHEVSSRGSEYRTGVEC